MKIKLPNSEAIRLLEELPLSDVANEANFLAPLHTTGRTASVLCDDPDYGKRLIAGELGTNDIWWEYELDREAGKLKVTGTVNEKSTPVKVVS
jgi:hypothetical protein